MRTRFAPSLTGYLHLGHVLHMLYVWGVAKACGAEVLYRIEDHDLGRARPEYETAIGEALEWLGFIPDVDGGRQSDRPDRYAAVLEELQIRGLVYGCACSRKQILETQSGGDELHYAGTCANKGVPLEGHTVRLRVPDGAVAFRDGLLGERTQSPAKQCGDFSLRDRNGQWTYQFACVVDDIDQGIDLVVRGEDILFSTGRQLQLFDVLGAQPPAFLHHPLICDARGKKLSKRQRSESITALREAGATAGEIIGRAATAGGLWSEPRPLSAAEGIELVRKIALNG